MYAGKDSCRGMVYIIFLGMITTLYTVLADIHVCDSAFQTEDGGYTPGKGQAACLTSSGTFLCDINACQSGSPSGPTDRKQKTLAVIKVYSSDIPDPHILVKKMFFTGCSLGDNGRFLVKTTLAIKMTCWRPAYLTQGTEVIMLGVMPPDAKLRARDHPGFILAESDFAG
ncbi:hypothetical protein MJO28_010495 [Puccinia striiformis f. sp. tritici]|uniref:Uncharacterized protein n=1 Tax=Puccinia striiformis f. sp. tritici TaxID=168172 RepID=A0ACC0E6U7_9BASI|nr:hypothetical protein MJO28_010495 [Puccinia striiformis f. sp. tritici]